MADYILKSEWEAIDAAAMSLKSGDTLLASKQSRKNSTMTEPVGVDENGKLFVRPAGESGGNGSGGIINYPPASGIPEEDLSEDVRKKLTEQIVYNFATPTAYEDFFNRYGDDLKRGDIVIILDTDGNGKTVVYQLGKNSLDPTALTPVVEIQPASGEPGPAGNDGNNAVIWYTNVAPNNSTYFVISNLLGPAGEVPSPGHMIVSGYTGRGYFITAVDNDAVTIADYSVQITGNDGNPGTNGVDGGYYTIKVEQLNSQNVKMSFIPSKEGMETILPEVITLPQGPQGPKGTDGTSVTHSWNGTTLTVTSAAGTSSADLKGNTGDVGPRGVGLLPITTAPSSYTTAVNGLTPTYRISLSTVKSQASVTEVFAGDTLRYSYYHYPVIYVDASYVYCGARVSIRGAAGEDGKTAYQYAQDGGYAGTEAEFAEKLASEYNPNPLYGKKVSFLGDSICAGADTNVSYLGGYGKIIADRNGMIYENLARAGSTITAETYSSSTGSAKGWISRMIENMSADADYAIVEGGINDAWQWYDHKNIEIGEITTGYNATLDDTTYYGAFESMLKQLITKFQGKKIGYIAVPKMMNLYDSNQNAPNFYHIALECCAKWGVPVCDLNTIIPPTEYLKTLGSTYTADGTHPTYEGYIKYYCDPIEAWMKTLTTGGSISTGTLPSDLDDKYVLKNDISIKKAQLTLENGSTVLIDVVVASAGTTIQKYKNLVPTSIDTNGNIYNGVGYKVDTRLSSTGEEKTMADSVVCGFIQAKSGDVIRLGGLKWWNTGGTNYLCAYDSNFNYIGCIYGHAGKNYGTKIHSAVVYGEDVSTVTLDDVSNIAYIRANWTDGVTAINSANGGDIILTVNEEIV